MEKARGDGSARSSLPNCPLLRVCFTLGHTKVSQSPVAGLADSSGCCQRHCIHGQMCCSPAPPGHPADTALWQPRALFLSVVCDFLSLQVLQILIYLRKPCYGDCQHSDASWGHAICDFPFPTQVTAADRLRVGTYRQGLFWQL